MKFIIASLLIFCLPSDIFSQNSLSKHSSRQNLIPGMYKKWEEFINNNPSIKDTFTVVTNYSLTNKGDTIVTGSTFKFLDSTIKRKHIVGFFDGKQLYFEDVINSNLISFLSNKQKFIHFDYIGRFPFTTLTRKTIYLGGDAILSLVGVADALISHPKTEIWYLNKNGKLLQATSQAIGFLIRNEKDFTGEFNSEKKLTTEVFKKYIIKMNERYPL